MSSPPVGGSGDSPEPNWYPDPSIPGYIRYWNGSSWVPGTSRPEPREGEALPTRPGGGAAGPAEPAAPAGAARPAEETGPLFFDEDPPAADDSGEQPLPRQSTPGALPELRTRSSEGPTWSPDDDVSTSPVAAIGRGGRPVPGQDAPVDPRTPFGRPPAGKASPAGSGPDEPDAREQTIGIRRADIQGSWPQQVRELAKQDPSAAAPAAAAPTDAPPAAPASPASPASPAAPAADGVERREQPPAAARPAAGTPVRQGQGQVPAQSGPPQPVHASPAPPAQQAPAQPAHPSPAPPQSGPPQPVHPSPAYPLPSPAQPVHPSPVHPLPHPAQPAHPSPVHPVPGGQQAQRQPSPPTQSGVLGAPQMTPLTEAGLAVRPTAPWETAFGGSGQAYPAGPGRRLLARIIDSILPLGAAAAVAVPLVDRARDHIQARVDAIETAGVNETIWLIDSTTAPYLAMVLGAFLLAGLLLDALPTAIWGRTLGKAACRIRVLDMSSQEKPGFGAALSRWLVYSLLGMLVIGLLNVLWCLWDRPWRQCWHDKAARTFVASAASPSSAGR